MEKLELESLGMHELNLNEGITTNGGCDQDGKCVMGYIASTVDFFSGLARGIGDGLRAGFNTVVKS